MLSGTPDDTPGRRFRILACNRQKLGDLGIRERVFMSRHGVLNLFPMSYFHVKTTPMQAPNMTIVAIQPVVLR